MTELTINYTDHDGVVELVDRIRYCAESISLAFTDWDAAHVKGPGLYFAVVSDRRYGRYADAMGENRWPVEQCRTAFDDEFYETARTVALERDGGVVVAVDGVVEPQMVRFRDLGSVAEEGVSSEAVAYEEWMGSRHMSAIETSIRPEVVATVTLSEETGRVSVFRDGVADTVERGDIGEPWREEE